MSFKQKTLNGLIWSSLDNLILLGVNFITGIVLARLLSPREFGLIGMTTIFIALGQSLADSGFGHALIRKKECTQADYSTVFFFNIAVGVFWYLLLVSLATTVATFFHEPQLKPLLPILGLGVILNTLSLIQTTLLTKRVDFKLQARISGVSSILSGVIGLVFAFKGYGVWSLVALTLSKNALNTLFLWLWNGWKPSLIFDIYSFKEMFGFGSKLLGAGLIDTAYRNIYLAVIGKYFSAIELGYYTRADAFNQLPSQNITSVIQRVSYPVLSSIRDDIPKLKAGYKKLIKSTMLISFVLMFGMSAVAKPLVLAMIGEKWLVSAEYLQLLCFVGMFYPLHALNLNILKVIGRSDLYLKLEVIKKIVAIPIIIIGINYGIKWMIIAMIIHSLIGYYLNSYWSGRFICYSMLDQIKDILPSFMLALFMGSIVFLSGQILHVSPWIALIVQIITGSLLTIAIAELVKLDSYVYIKYTLIEQINKRV